MKQFLILLMLPLYSISQNGYYCDVTYHELDNLTDSVIFNNKHRDLIIDSKKAEFKFEMDGQVLVFKNTISKKDSAYYKQGKYFKKIYTVGEHFEIKSGLNTIYSINRIRLKSANDTSLLVHANFQKLINGKLVEAGNIEKFFLKKDLEGVLFGSKITYTVKEKQNSTKRQVSARKKKQNEIKVLVGTIVAGTITALVVYIRSGAWFTFSMG